MQKSHILFCPQTNHTIAIFLQKNL